MNVEGAAAPKHVMDRWGERAAPPEPKLPPEPPDPPDDDTVKFSAHSTLEILQQVLIFQEVGLSKEFLEYLVPFVEDRPFRVGERIVEEGCSEGDDKSCYIIAQGTAKVLKEGVQVATLDAGAVFGELVMMGIVTERQSTVVAERYCQAKILAQGPLMEAFKVFPQERQKMLMLALQQYSRSQGDEDAVCGPVSQGAWKRQNLRIVIRSVQKSKYFSKMCPLFVEELSKVSVDRIYMPSEVVIQAGDVGDSMFIMVSGTACVYVPVVGSNTTVRVGVLGSGSIFGELAMLGVSNTRLATIEAETICCMWEISQDKAFPIIELFPLMRTQFGDLIVKNLEHSVSPRMDACPLFASFDRKFRMLLGLYSERRTYFPGEPIFSEGRIADGLFIINCGKATLSKRGVDIKQHGPNSFFNSTIMLGIHRTALFTLTSVQTCHIIVVNRESYLQAVEQYPVHRKEAVKLQAQEEASSKEFLKHAQQFMHRKLIHMRRQGRPAKARRDEHLKHIVEQARQGKTAEDVANEVVERVARNLLKAVVKQWSRNASRCSQERKQLESRQASQHEWLAKRSRAAAKVADAREMEAISLPTNTWEQRQKEIHRLSQIYIRKPKESDTFLYGARCPSTISRGITPRSPSALSSTPSASRRPTSCGTSPREQKKCSLRSQSAPMQPVSPPHSASPRRRRPLKLFGMDEGDEPLMPVLSSKERTNHRSVRDGFCGLPLVESTVSVSSSRNQSANRRKTSDLSS